MPMPSDSATPHPELQGWQSLFYRSGDGLRLHIAETGDRHAARLPVICLPGLTRNALDFEVVGNRIARDQGRRVLAFDYRGRGLSDYDSDWKKYDLMVELEDLHAALTALGIPRALFLGNSRGGLLTMLTAITRPGVLAGAILNDIGAIIEAQGLARIRSYVGKIPTPRSEDQAVITLKHLFGGSFPEESDESWLAFARRVWRSENGQLVPRYDTNLMRTLADLDLEKPIPPLWPQFDALKPVPFLLIRGELSDLLSQETAEAMVARHQQGEFGQPARLHIAPKQGHAPLLEDEPTIAAILDFLAIADPA
ncbi:alpha/beta fold hydrolase [Rhabdaerophilum sp.]|uniref:alpha/beta fold hydrolase n=1 Tax=Rhabdaerophilum sp. TaxID=2717341 RepID=UPI0038D503D8